MKKKILALCLVVVLAITAVTGATLAYFTDTAEATNVFTVGNVDIELIESYVHRGAGTSYENTGANHPYPDVASGKHTDEQVLSGSGEKYVAYLADQIMTPGVAINKMPYVKNNSKTTAAWVRIHVLIPAALDTAHLNSSHICTESMKQGEFKRPDGIGQFASNGSKTVGGVNYNVYTFIRTQPLAPETMTEWNVWSQITMDKTTTSADLVALKAAGAITDNGNFNVLVQADAIQASADLTTPELAWAAFDGANN